MRINEVPPIFDTGGYRYGEVSATELLKSMDVRDVRKFSRHRSLETMMIYDDEVSVKEKAKQVMSAMEKFAMC